MNIELVPGLTNVVRFPLEERVKPSMALIHEIEPDVRDVLQVDDAFGLGLVRRALFEASDQETARFIAEQVLPASPSELRERLAELLNPVLENAVEACRTAHAASVASTAAHVRAHAAKVNGIGWLEGLEARAAALGEHAAALLVEAHNACEQARGVNRAVGFARRGERWVPYAQVHETEIDFWTRTERRHASA